MTRLLILVTILLFIVSNVSAQVVDALNTVLGPVTQGAKVAVTWTLLPGVDATGKNGDLSATDSATKNVIDIDPAVPLAPKTYLWEVKVPPGTYTLGLNDGAGLKQSGEVVVKAPAGGAPPAGGPPAGGPPAGGPPAGGPPAAGTPPTTPPTTPPAGKAPAPAPAPSSGTSDNTPPPAGSTPSASAPSPSSGAAAATPASGSASAIFSGYEVVFSLLGVAIAMVQF